MSCRSRHKAKWLDPALRLMLLNPLLPAALARVDNEGYVLNATSPSLIVADSSVEGWSKFERLLLLRTLLWGIGDLHADARHYSLLCVYHRPQVSDHDCQDNRFFFPNPRHDHLK